MHHPLLLRIDPLPPNRLQNQKDKPSPIQRRQRQQIHHPKIRRQKNGDIQHIQPDIKNPVLPAALIIGAVLNTILDPIFIFVLGLGVRGAALATILSQAVSAVWVLRFLTGRQTKWRIRREYL